jgi:isopenicillin-N epimerase
MHLKDQFLLDPDIHFLNHGSFGASPRPVLETCSEWQRELEKRPVEFLGRRSAELMAEAREKLAAYLHCATDEVVYFPNPTTVVNMVVRSLDLGPDDEILASDHEYGAMDRTWRFLTGKFGGKYLHQPIPLPVTTHADFVESFWAGVTNHTKVIFLSHITSATALIFPIEEICRRAREAGILTIIDGAHAPGQIPLDLSALGADIYTGACHKWLCAPKGSAFLYTRKEVQDQLEPLVVSWGYEAEEPSGSQYVDHHEWQGTRDISAFLSVPAAIEFQASHDWSGVRLSSHELLKQARDEISALTGLEPLCPDDQGWFQQMAVVQLPKLDEKTLKTRLYDEYQVEAPCYRWNDVPLLRISVQGYNTEEDIRVLVNGLKILLPELTP